MIQKITGAECVLALKMLKKSSTAKEVAAVLQSDSRNVATALRKPCKDGRVKWGKFVRGVATYRYLRSTPAKAKGGAA